MERFPLGKLIIQTKIFLFLLPGIFLPTDSPGLLMFDDQ